MKAIEVKPIHVLLVEDSPGDARLLREMCAEVPSAQFVLTHVERLSDALQRLEEDRFDVVVLDLSLPDSHGFETFVKVHEHTPEVPVVVLTGLDDESLAMTAVQKGAQDYLVKGQVNGSLLVRSVLYAIERQRTIHYRALLVEQKRFDTAVSQMSDGIVVTDGDWRITTANRAAELLLNLPQDGWEGTALDNALQSFTLSPSLTALQSSDERITVVDITRPHTQPPLFLDARLTRLFDSTGNLASVVLTLRDVTDERHARHLQTNFFMLISHKLRTPLCVLGGYLDLLRRLPPEHELKEQNDLQEVCRMELQRLDKVVQNLLEFKALSTQQLQAIAQQTDVAAAVAAVIEEVRRRYPSKPTEVTTEVPPDTPPADAGTEHVRLVLEKLLDNAVKFGDKDPVRVHIKVEHKEPAWLQCSVSDNGPGVPHEYHERVFEGFVQVEDRVTGQVPGLGVGLFIARQVVEAYGGSISIQSRIGEGTAVSFILPAAAHSPTSC